MARYVRVTPRKARRVVDMIRGMPAEEAQAVLSFAPQAASAPVRKVLVSAVANAGQAGGPDAAFGGAWLSAFVLAGDKTKEKSATRISSTSVKIRPESRSSKRLRQNTPSCNERHI